MCDWRDGTQVDVKDAGAIGARLADKISGEFTAEHLNSIWRAHLDVEKSVVFTRVEINEEIPSRFVRLNAHSLPDERQTLQLAF